MATGFTTGATFAFGLVFTAFDLAFTATALALVAVFAFATDFLVWAAFFARAAFLTVFFIFVLRLCLNPGFAAILGEKITEL